MSVKKIIKETINDFDWVSDVPTPTKIPHWSGRSDGTEPREKTFIYVDDNGEEHSVKVGGIKYISFNGVGAISFYDASITDAEIQLGNVDVDYDAFYGKYGIEITRPQYNEYIKSGRLRHHPYHNIYSVNESDFDWVSEIKPFNLNDNNWVIEVVNSDEWYELQEFLFSNGWGWDGEDDDYPDDRKEMADYDNKYHFFFPDSIADMKNTFDAANEKYVQKLVGLNSFLRWSEIKKFHINEEKNDFEWINTVTITPKGHFIINLCDKNILEKDILTGIATKFVTSNKIIKQEVFNVDNIHNSISSMVLEELEDYRPEDRRFQPLLENNGIVLYITSHDSLVDKTNTVNIGWDFCLDSPVQNLTDNEDWRIFSYDEFMSY